MVDYSKFEEIEKAEKVAEAEENAGQGELKEKVKYVDSDGETVDGEESDDGDDSDDEDLHPLFWTKLPKPGSKAAEMEKVLKDLVYKNENDEDKSPNELAQDFKEKGNEFFKWGEKFYKRALKEYKEALQWARRGDGSEENRVCYAAILSNRAAINLKFRNYGSVVRDCEAAIQYGPDPLPNCKPHFRAASACLALEKAKKGLEFCKSGLKIDPENGALKEIQGKLETMYKAQRKTRMEKERKDMQERKLDEAMRKACVARNIKVGPMVNDLQHFLANAVGKKTKGGFPRPMLGEDGSMKWSVLFMYPEHMQTDYIQEFDITHTFHQHLEVMFPENAQGDPSLFAPWDETRDYTIDAIEVYFEEKYVVPYNMNKMWEAQYKTYKNKDDYTKRRRVLVNQNKTLLDAISDPEYIVPGVPTFYVVSNRTPFYKDTFVPQHEGRLRKL